MYDDQSPNVTADPATIGERNRLRQERLVEYLGELLIPTTEGFEQINLDMTFSFLGNYELSQVDNMSDCINLCRVFGLKQSEFLLRGRLATLLNSRRSRGGKSMDMFTTVSTEQKQTFTDTTEKKGAFNFFKTSKDKR